MELTIEFASKLCEYGVDGWEKVGHEVNGVYDREVYSNATYYNKTTDKYVSVSRRNRTDYPTVYNAIYEVKKVIETTKVFEMVGKLVRFNLCT